MEKLNSFVLAKRRKVLVPLEYFIALGLGI